MPLVYALSIGVAAACLLFALITSGAASRPVVRASTVACASLGVVTTLYLLNEPDFLHAVSHSIALRMVAVIAAVVAGAVALARR